MENIINLFISNAYADTMGALPSPQQGGSLSFVLIFLFFFGFIYFAIWRPQNKRAKEQQTMLSALAKGDEVMTAGGLLGRIVKINEQYIVLSVANNVDIVMQKSAVVNVLPKGTIKSLE